jgi:hypothetical protein
MSKSKQWADWLDERKAQEHFDYVLHRNYIERGQYVYSTYPDSEQRSGRRIVFIGNTKPIAVGITAFLAGDNRSSEYVKYYLQKEKDFSTVNTYLLYFHGCQNEFLKRKESLPYHRNEQDNRQDFLSEHLQQEKKNYLKSTRYFIDNKDEYDKRLNERLREYVKGYFMWLESLQENNNSVKPRDAYEIKSSRTLADKFEQNKLVIKESVVIKLWEEFGSLFPGETKQNWQKRWSGDPMSLIPIEIENFKEGNNKHLLLSILYLARPKMNVPNMNEYVKNHWGLTSYNSDIAKHISHSDQPHPELKKIEQILKSA